jgi:N-hydroxyarylamine O-acetyltransferase
VTRWTRRLTTEQPLDPGVNADAYLARLGLERDAVTPPDSAALAHLQRTHVRTVPFENLAITGPPGDDETGPGVSLALPQLFEKIVRRERGGFCYELNGLFGWLLADLGYDVDRIAGGVLDDDGVPSPPANHLTSVVTLDRRYVVDVGVATPTIRRPLPLDGEVVEDEAGVAWRVRPSDRPDADYRTEFRRPGRESFEPRYVFRDVPRDLDYVAATCEYLTTAPESPFTGEPFLTIATAEGHAKLKAGTLSHSVAGEVTEESVPEAAWPAVVEREFGIRLAGGD